MLARCRTFLGSVVLSTLLMGPAAAGPFEDGSAAYQRGDFTTAFRLWRPLAERGDGRAQGLLGLMYRQGKGVLRDDREAAHWYRLAAAQGFAVLQYELGVMYSNGQGVPEDHREAVRWYRMAAEQGEADAQLNLGAMYANGEGVPRDYVQAYMWFNLAAAQGQETAMNNREILTRLMTPAQIAEAQALARNWKPKK